MALEAGQLLLRWAGAVLCMPAAMHLHVSCSLACSTSATPVAAGECGDWSASSVYDTTDLEATICTCAAKYLGYNSLLRRRVYGMEGVYVHDATALAAVVKPELFDWHAGAVVVATDGPAKGHTIRDEGAGRACVWGVLCHAGAG